MTNARREHVAREIVRSLPGFGTWSEAISEYPTPWGKVGYRQLELLWVIRHHLLPEDRVTPKAIATYFLVQPSVVTRLVAKLESHGFVRRVFDPNDGRSFWIDLTPAGIEVSEYVENLHDQEVLDALGNLTDQQLAQLAESLPLLREIGVTLHARSKARLRG